MKRILWLATADARGHLMRCQLLAHALGARGVDIDVVTTSEDGRSFLSAFGVGAGVLSPHYRVEFDPLQNMARRRTEWRVVRYFTSPARFPRDLAWLATRARDAHLVVNDSFHPALLVARRLSAGRALPPIVHVYGQDLRAALEQNFAGRMPPALEGMYRGFIASCVDAGFARIEHALATPPGGAQTGPRTWRLPPVVALPARGADEVRAALGVGRGARLVVVYLNPHFRAPEVAAAIEAAFPPPAFVVHAVGEGFAARVGWRARDARLADAIGAADLFVSAPGMGALAQAHALGVPFVAVVTDQPEQVANLARLRRAGDPVVAEVPVGDGLAAALASVAHALPGPSEATRRAHLAAPPAREDTVDLWCQVLLQLLDEADREARARHEPPRPASSAPPRPASPHRKRAAA